MSKIYIVAGVSGVGKTTIGILLAERENLPFFDADDFHPEANVKKMGSGLPLTDEDRKPWLATLRDLLDRYENENGAVLACSSLTEVHRAVLWSKASPLWIFLSGDFELIRSRMENRRGHYFKPELLRSQFDTYDNPLYGLHFDVTKTPEEIVDSILEKVYGKSEFGLMGMGVMGTSLARNLGRNQVFLSLYNRSVPNVEDEVAQKAVEKYGELSFAKGYDDIKEFIASLEKPRKIFLMVPAGKTVDTVLNAILPFLEEGDIVMDGGNSHYEDTERRQKDLQAKNIEYLGVGVSGGEEGALNGPSIMPGGSTEAYGQVAKFLEAIAAKDKEGKPCCQLVGNGGAGHFVKMIHNGMEYAEMQLLAETYQLLRFHIGYSPSDIATLFESWIEGGNGSYLLEITVKILRYKDEEEELLLDKILDKASQKGTGNWSTIAALKIGTPAPLISEAVIARYISALKTIRVNAEGLYGKPSAGGEGDIDIEALSNAFEAVRIINHASGFDLIQKASDEYGWNVDLSAIARIWTNGCIIRSSLMEEFSQILSGPRSTVFEYPSVVNMLKPKSKALATITSLAIKNGCAVPMMGSAVNLYHGLTTSRGPANLIQAQRDFFGAHTYQKIDDENWYHTIWENGTE